MVLKDQNHAYLVCKARASDYGEHKIKPAADLTERLVKRNVKGLATLPQETRRWLRNALGRLRRIKQERVGVSIGAARLDLHARRCL